MSEQDDNLKKALTSLVELVELALLVGGWYLAMRYLEGS